MATEQYQADKDFSIEGHWSRPGGQHKPPGKLYYTEGNLELQLQGAFDDAEGPHPFVRSMPELDPKIIHGHSVKGTPVTLLSSFYTNWQQQSGTFFAKGPVPIASSTLTCNGMLFGVHLSNEDDESFTHCTLKIPNLDRWLDDRPFETKMDVLTSISVNYEMPEKRCFEIPGCGKFCFLPTVTPPFHVWDDLTIKHRTYVVLEPETPKNFAWFVQAADHIERLFTLLFGRVAKATNNRLTFDSGDESGEAYVYLPSDRISQAVMNPIDFLTRYPKISQWFGQILNSWFTETVEIRYTLDLLFSSLQRPGKFLETRFMPFVQAIEVYSRVTNSGHIVEKAIYKPIRESVINSIPKSAPSELHEAIVKSLSYANERTLRERILALIHALEPETRALFCIDAQNFAKGVVDTRNFYTHYSSDPKKALDDLPLHWATIKLQTMMKILLLIKIGIPESEVRTIIQSNYHLNNDRRSWSELPELPSH
jgi:hypothetical protein